MERAMSRFRTESQCRVSEGRVYCPRSQTDKDVDACWGCVHLIDVAQSAQGTTVHCAPRKPMWRLNTFI
jgi:hypothetical protein